MAKNTKKKKTGSGKGVWIVAAVLFAAIVAFIVMIVMSGSEIEENRAAYEAQERERLNATIPPTATPEPTPTPVPTPVPTPTPHVLVSREDAPEGKAPGYLIVVSKHAQLAAVYALDKSGEYTIPVKCMIASVPVNEEEVPNGLYYTNDANRWITLSGEKAYAQYATRIQGGMHFHSVEYSKQRPDKIVPDSFYALGTSAGRNGITLLTGDAKWIYANCRAGTPVIIMDGSEYDELSPSLVSLPEVKKNNPGWDPTDDHQNNKFYVAPKKAPVYPTPYPKAVPNESPYPFK